MFSLNDALRLRIRPEQPRWNALAIAMLGPFLGQGTYKPLIDRRYTLEDIREAFVYVDSGRKIGNVLLTIP